MGGKDFDLEITKLMNKKYKEKFNSELDLKNNKALIAGFGFMIVGIMVKAAVFPMHIWLPRAYAYAPSAVSVLLAATATKASLYILARILFSVFDRFMKYKR